PYRRLVEENERRGRDQPELELLDTGVFDGNRYFDVFVEYAKADADDYLIRIEAFNRGPETAELDLLPTVWFRNTWSWDWNAFKPTIEAGPDGDGFRTILTSGERYGKRRLMCEGQPQLLFTENETNVRRMWGLSRSGFFKDAFHNHLIGGKQDAVNPEGKGTKAAAWRHVTIAPGDSHVFRLRFHPDDGGERSFADFDKIFSDRKSEADAFYAELIPETLSGDAKNVMRQALGGLLWSKQYYHYVVRRWLSGDPAQPPPPQEREHGRNSAWGHIYNADVLSMPDKWEYPWYAAWDLAFHMLPLSLVDAGLAKHQLMLMLREWYMHPNGQLPAYEWAFGDANPPVHAWACWRVFKMEQRRCGKGDYKFLERVFQKLLLNFTWWVNRKDAEGRNVFEGGFLGLDNIGCFDRSSPPPTGGHIEQADGTGWMGMYCLAMLALAIELACKDSAYEDMASKFWEHFLYIAHAINSHGPNEVGMWDEQDGFFYDVLQLPDGSRMPMKTRPIVGLIPLFAVGTLEPDILDKLPGFHRRLKWFIANRPDLTANIACMETPGEGRRRLLSIANPDQLRRILAVLLDENEFLSPHGIRSVSRLHKDHPFSFHVDGTDYSVDYEPGDSKTTLFGGNSNWRGPVWFPINYLLVESLQRFHHYLGDEYQVECPTGSGRMMNLWQVAEELSHRLSGLFLRDQNGRRPVHGDEPRYRDDPHWKDLVLFYECFHGDNGRGVGASHQTGWTALTAKLMQQNGT
ncbi:MAG: glucosidase, partial [Planctomycetales bacterium]|nr:glucosidase [Planctomycetales bacterium]